MDTVAQWPQQDMVKPMEDMMLPLPNPSSSRNNKVVTKPHKERGCFSCPRCNSNNTKFCYYNNYSLSQPRFFCKTCRRYWTQGGSLRNIPVGGASRKNVNKITSSPSSNNNNSKKQQNPSTTRDQLHLMKSFMPTFQTPNSLDLLTSSSRVLYNNYALMPLVGHSSLPELNKSPNSSSLNFSLDGLGGNYGHFLGAQQNNNNNNSDNKILFPFEDLKLQDSHTDRDPGNGFWNGVVGGGSW